MNTLVVLGVVVFVPMLLEARRSARNEREQRARGGIEPRGDVYAAMKVVYPAAFAAMLAEGAWRPAAPTMWTAAGFALFGAAKALKWWAITSLGRAWSFRVIVVPGDRLVDRGPYRMLPHPNYVAVSGELVGAALAAGARVTGPIATVLFGVLMWRRVRVEARALRVQSRIP